jgi:hypothetical protein
MYCVIKCVKNKRVLKGNFVSSVFHSCNAKTPKTQICVTGPQCVKYLSVNDISLIYQSWLMPIPSTSHKNTSGHTAYHDYQLTVLIHTKIQIEIPSTEKNCTLKWYTKQMQHTQKFTPTTVNRETLKLCFKWSGLLQLCTTAIRCH